MPPAQEGWKAKDDPLTALGTLLPEEPGFPGWPPGDSDCIKQVKEGLDSGNLDVFVVRS